MVLTEIALLKWQTNVSLFSEDCWLAVQLLVPRINNHLSSFELGFLNIFSRQTMWHSLSLVLFFFFFFLRCNKYGEKNVKETIFDSAFEMIRHALANQKTGKQQKNP